MYIIPIELAGLDRWIGFLLGMLAGIIVQGEAQWFYCCLWLPFSQRHQVRYDLNPLNHLSAWNIPALALAGWGWSCKQVAPPPSFPATRLQHGMLHLSSGLANLLLVGILSSLYSFFPYPGFEAAIAINLQMALASLLIPLPPLALGRALGAGLLPPAFQDSRARRIGAVILALLLLAEHIASVPGLRAGIMRLSLAIFPWLLG